MKFGGPERFPRKKPEHRELSGLEDIANKLKERVDQLPTDGTGDKDVSTLEYGEAFGSPDLGDLVRKIQRRNEEKG